MFIFKQFVIRQDNAAMKAGTDGVLLGAWCDLDGASSILDIGTGTGLIALMCAQRAATARVTAIEIDEGASREARQNVKESRFDGRIEVVNCDFKDFGNHHAYSHIVSNPPYFTEDTGSPDPRRKLARQSISLPFDTLIKGVKKILAPGGKFSVIIPWGTRLDFVRLCALAGLHLCRKTAVMSRQGREPIRALLTFTDQIMPLEQDLLAIRDLKGNFSTPYKQLTADFYLNF